MEGDWNVITPDAAGIDAKPLGALVEWLDRFQSANIHSVLVVRGGALCFEHYRRGSDQHWDQSRPNFIHSSSTKHDLRSITKSVTALLIGIAIDQRYIAGIDEPLFRYFSDYADLRTADKDRITLRHLLTMSAGFEWDEYIPYTDPNNSETRMLQSSDRWRFALTPRLIAPPGLVWNYNGGCTELLGAIVSRATGRPIEQYAHEMLFSPLAISDVEWSCYADKIPAAASGLRLRSRDLAKIGQLLLEQGRCCGKQVVSEQWIAESTAAHIGPADRLFFFGLHWWLGRSLIDRREIRWIAASGLGGQKLFIVPELDLVAVITAGHYGNPMEAWLPLLIFNRYVLTAARP